MMLKGAVWKNQLNSSTPKEFNRDTGDLSVRKRKGTSNRWLVEKVRNESKEKEN